MAPPRGGGGGSGRVAGQKPVLRWGRPPAGAWTPPRCGRPGARGGEDAASRAYPRSMTVATLQDEALALLRELAGPDAEFREHQLEAIAALAQERRRVLCVQRTGWGKSAVYFIATALLRRGGAGRTVLISPRELAVVGRRRGREAERAVGGEAQHRGECDLDLELGQPRAQA